MFDYKTKKANNKNDFKGLADLEGILIPDGLLELLEKDTEKNETGEIVTGGYFCAPASTRFHGSYEGGLYDHSRRVFMRLKQLTHDNELKWEREESPFIIGMFHDLCKIDSYRRIQLLPEIRYCWNDAAEDQRHAEKSISILEKYIDLTDEERDCILYHMGPYTSRNADWDTTARLYANYDAAITRHENVLWTHMADMLASKIDKT